MSREVDAFRRPAVPWDQHNSIVGHREPFIPNMPRNQTFNGWLPYLTRVGVVADGVLNRGSFPVKSYVCTRNGFSYRGTG